jgi:hypothetical protein
VSGGDGGGSGDVSLLSAHVVCYFLGMIFSSLSVKLTTLLSPLLFMN